MNKGLLALVAMLTATPAVQADTQPAQAAPETVRTLEPVHTADYAAAARFAPSRLAKMVGTMNVRPTWLKHSERFWYSYQTGEGVQWYLVDPAAGKKSRLFDTDALAAKLALTMQDAFDARNLPLTEIEFVDNDRKVRFQVKGSQTDEEEKKKEEAKTKAKVEAANKEGDSKRAKRIQDQAKKDFKKIYTFELDLATGSFTHLVDFKPPKDDPAWANFSPDETKVVYAKGFDLYWMDIANLEKAKEDEDDATIVEHRLTDDGAMGYDYSGNSMGSRRKSDEDEAEQMRKRTRASVSWSHDSRRIALVRNDNRKVQPLWVIDTLAKPRPTLETYSYAMPGDKDVTQTELWVFDVAAGTKKKLDIPAFKDQDLQVLITPLKKRNRADKRQPVRWFSSSPDQLYVYRRSRDLKRLDVVQVNVDTGEAKVRVEERFNTANDFGPPVMVGNGRELIFWSERDGWGHFYLYDDQGKVKNAITRGTFTTAPEIEAFDEKNRVLYFSGFGREPGQNPYYRHLYRVNLDGSGLKLLNEGNFDFFADVSDSGRYAVTNYSRVDAAPKSEVRDATGKVVMKLEEADVSRLLGSGFKYPETFKVKADDGITDLYGVMYKPYNFDPARKYPVIAWVYPGPQTESVEASFGIDSSLRVNSAILHAPALAQFGYIVVTVGNRGGHPNRSRAYQDFSYGNNFRDYGLADKKTALEQLAARHAFIDIDRVGIYGHSGGGFMSTAAMLVYPDFFKVAVSSAGNHDNNIYNRWWSERYNGVKEETSEKDKGETSFKVALTENPELARNLKGRLMLVAGEIDNNVHPAGTYRVVEALINAGKRFDLLVIPSARHAITGTAGEYFHWARADFFNKYLMGDMRDTVDMVDMMREIPQTRK